MMILLCHRWPQFTNIWKMKMTRMTMKIPKNINFMLFMKLSRNLWIMLSFWKREIKELLKKTEKHKIVRYAAFQFSTIFIQRSFWKILICSKNGKIQFILKKIIYAKGWNLGCLRTILYQSGGRYHRLEPMVVWIDLVLDHPRSKVSWKLPNQLIPALNKACAFLSKTMLIKNLNRRKKVLW